VTRVVSDVSRVTVYCSELVPVLGLARGLGMVKSLVMDTRDLGNYVKVDFQLTFRIGKKGKAKGNPALGPELIPVKGVIS